MNGYIYHGTTSLYLDYFKQNGINGIHPFVNQIIIFHIFYERYKHIFINAYLQERYNPGDDSIYKYFNRVIPRNIIEKLNNQEDIPSKINITTESNPDEHIRIYFTFQINTAIDSYAKKYKIGEGLSDFFGFFHHLKKHFSHKIKFTDNNLINEIDSFYNYIFANTGNIILLKIAKDLFVSNEFQPIAVTNYFHLGTFEIFYNNIINFLENNNFNNEFNIHSQNNLSDREKITLIIQNIQNINNGLTNKEVIIRQRIKPERLLIEEIEC